MNKKASVDSFFTGTHSPNI